MHTFFALARFFPYWAFPLALLSGEVAWYYYRKKSSQQYLFWGVSAVLLVLMLLWIAFRGDLNSDEWVRYFSGG
jgi:hypothetical protein